MFNKELVCVDLYRSSRPAECEAHWGPTGERSPLTGAPSQNEPSGLPPPFRQSSAEDDWPEADRLRPRSLNSGSQRVWNQHVFTSTAAGDHEGPVLMSMDCLVLAEHLCSCFGLLLRVFYALPYCMWTDKGRWSNWFSRISMLDREGHFFKEWKSAIMEKQIFSIFYWVFLKKKMHASIWRKLSLNLDRRVHLHLYRWRRKSESFQR